MYTNLFMKIRYPYNPFQVNEIFLWKWRMYTITIYDRQ